MASLNLQSIEKVALVEIVSIREVTHSSSRVTDHAFNASVRLCFNLECMDKSFFAIRFFRRALEVEATALKKYPMQFACKESIKIQSNHWFPLHIPLEQVIN